MKTIEEALDPTTEPLRSLKGRKKKHLARVRREPDEWKTHWEQRGLAWLLYAVGRYEDALALVVPIASAGPERFVGRAWAEQSGWEALALQFRIQRAAGDIDGAERTRAVILGNPLSPGPHGKGPQAVRAAVEARADEPAAELAGIHTLLSPLACRAVQGPDAEAAEAVVEEAVAVLRKRFGPKTKRPRARPKPKAGGWAWNERTLRTLAEEERHPVMAERIDALATCLVHGGKGRHSRTELYSVGWCFHALGRPDASDVFALARTLASPTKLGRVDEVREVLASWIETAPGPHTDERAELERRTRASLADVTFGSGQRYEPAGHLPHPSSDLTAGRLGGLGSTLSELAAQVHDGTWPAPAVARARAALEGILALIRESLDTPRAAQEASRRSRIAASLKGDPNSKSAPACFDPAGEVSPRIEALKAKVHKKYRPGSEGGRNELLPIASALLAAGRRAEAMRVLDVLCDFQPVGSLVLWRSVVGALALRIRFGERLATEVSDDRFRLAQNRILVGDPVSDRGFVDTARATLEEAAADRAWSRVSFNVGHEIGWMAYLAENTDDPVLIADAKGVITDGLALLASRL